MQNKQPISWQRKFVNVCKEHKISIRTMEEITRSMIGKGEEDRKKIGEELIEKIEKGEIS